MGSLSAAFLPIGRVSVLHPRGRVSVLHPYGSVSKVRINSTTMASFTEVGFEIHHFKFTIRLPKLRLRKPKSMRKKKYCENLERSSSMDDLDVDWKQERQNRLNSLINRNANIDNNFIGSKGSSSSSSSSSSPPSSSPPSEVSTATNTSDWIKEFHERYHPMVATQNVDNQSVTKNVIEIHYENLVGTLPRTSAPVNLMIQPMNTLNRAWRKDVHARYSHDISGVKIYENIEEENESMFSEDISDLKTSDNENDNSYEVVEVRNGTVMPGQKNINEPFLRRNLKYPYVSVGSAKC